MNTIIALLITLVIGFLTFCVITLNESKKEIWKVIYERLKK
jgi:hypothetical protein